MVKILKKLRTLALGSTFLIIGFNATTGMKTFVSDIHSAKEAEIASVRHINDLFLYTSKNIIVLSNGQNNTILLDITA